MPFPPTPYVWPFLAAGALNVALAALAWRRRSLLAARYLFALAVGAAFWAGAGAVTHWADAAATKVFWTHIRYVPITVMPVLWLLFSAAYAGLDRRITLSHVVVLLLIPLCTMVATATNGMHHLMFTDTRISTTGPIPTVVHDYGTWFWIHTIQAYALVGIGAGLIGLRVWRAATVFRGQGLAMIAGALAPVLANAVFLASPPALAYIDPTPVAFALSTLFFAVGVLRFHLFDILPVARSLVLENVTEGFVVLDMDGRILDMNAVAGHMLGAEPEGLLSRFAPDQGGLIATAWELRPRPDAPDPRTDVLAELLPAIPATVRSQVLSDEEALRRAPIRAGAHESNGLWLEWSVQSIETGRIAGSAFGRGWLVLIRDVTGHHEVEITLAQARDRAIELSALKSEFLSNLHHELRTPMAGIIGLSDVLIEELQGEPLEFARMIRESGERLMSTLDSLLAVAELDANRVVPELEGMDVAAETDAAVARIRPLAASKGLEVELRTPAGPCPALADPRHFAEILRHLLDNAVKYTDRGTVTVAITDLEAEVVVTIGDTGRGMKEDYLPKAFDSFTQAETGFNRSVDGSGVGLRVARGLAERMGARLDVESVSGLGSTFHLVLPGYAAPAAGETGAGRHAEQVSDAEGRPAGGRAATGDETPGPAPDRPGVPGAATDSSRSQGRWRERARLR